MLLDWRVIRDWAYRRGMARTNSPHIEPVRRLAELDQYAGLWVAVKDGKVIASAQNSRELVPMIREIGAAGEGAVASFVPHRSEEIVIGVG